MKGLIAHVAAYENWTAARVRAANEGRAPTDRELYGVNEMLLAEVMAFSRQAFANLVAVVEGVSEKDVFRASAQTWTGDTTLLEIIPGQCYARHADELRSVSGGEIP